MPLELEAAPKLRRLSSANYVAHLENVEKFRRSLSIPDRRLAVDASDSCASTSRGCSSGPTGEHSSPSPRQDQSGAVTERSKVPASARSTATRPHSLDNKRRPKIAAGTFGTAARRTFVDEVAERASASGQELFLPPPSLTFSRSVSISTASRWSDSGRSACSGDYNPDIPERKRSTSAVIGTSPRWQRVQVEKNGCIVIGSEKDENEGDALSLFSDDQSVVSSQRTARSSRQDRGRSFSRAPRFRDPSSDPLPQTTVGPGSYDAKPQNSSRKRRATSVHIATAGREIEPMISNAVILPSEVRARASMPGPGSYFRELVWGRGGVPFPQAGKARSSPPAPPVAATSSKETSPRQTKAQRRIAELAQPKYRKNDATKFVTETALMAQAFHPRR